MNDPRDPRSTSRWGDDVDDHPYGESAPFEKIARGSRVILPVSSGRNADRMAKKTCGSRRVKKQLSLKLGGMHRRRQKVVR